MKKSEAKIPHVKHITKAELLEELTRLKASADALQEELYTSGARQRPTIMSQIIDKENDILTSIKYLIETCEKETGRKFPWVFSIEQTEPVIYSLGSTIFKG